MAKYYPDLSHYHPVKDWDALKKAYPFVIYKCTEGTKETAPKSHTDPTVADFIKGCEKHGVKYWLYTFLHKGGELAQAKYLVSVAKKMIGKNFVGYIIDVESGNDPTNVKSALNYIKTQSKKTMIYTGYKDYEKYKSVIESRGSNCAWWEARYGNNDGQYHPNKYPCHKGVDLYQFTSKGDAKGVSGNNDMNVIVGNKREAWFTIASYTSGASKTTTKKTTTTKKSITDIAKEVIAGKWGTGDTRIAKLKKAGYNPDKVQDKVNELLKAPKAPAKKSITDIAKEVLAGKWGNGDDRKNKLKKAGYNPDKVQDKVNELLKK